jgi:hypothetical protein
MTQAGLPVWILDAPGVSNRNSIVLGGALGGLEKPCLTMPPEFSAAQIAEELDRMSFRPPRHVPAGRPAGERP